MKRIWFLLFLSAVLLLFGCQSSEMISFDEEGVYGAWCSMEEDKLHALFLSEEEAPSANTESDAVRVCKILEALDVQKMTVECLSQRLESTKAHPTILVQNVRITYESPLFDAFSFEADARFVKVDEVWRLLWDYDLLFPTMEEEDTVNFYTLSPTRGEIFTADRLCVAKNAFAPTLYVRPDEINGDENTLAQRLSALCGESAADILDAIHSDAAERDGLAVLRVYSPLEDLTELREAILPLAGVGIDESFITPVRMYPAGEYTHLLSHLIGYTGPIPSEQLEDYKARGYGEYDTVGISGLEAAYEETLRGEAGCVLQLTDEVGNVKSTLLKKDAVNGCDLTLTIQSDVQKAAEDALDNRLYSGQSGSLLRLEPTTGAIEAIASWPDYDNNFFTLPVMDQEAHDAEWDVMMESGTYPLLFRTIQGRYIPGSTAKVLTAMVAVESGSFSPNYVFNGYISDNMWRPNRSDWIYPPITRTHGYALEMNMTNALIHSDNIYFANAAMEIGAETYIEYMTKFGFFEQIPFDLSVSQAQVSASDDRTFVENIKFLADLGYGQGEMLCTPMEMAVLYSALANGGTIMVPYVVAHTDRMENGEYVRVSTTEPKIWRENIVSQSTIDTITPMMRGVITSGTAASLNLDGYGLCGKTGTAETANNGQNSWFIGFTTESDPRLICVLLDVRSNQGGASQPLARDLLTAEHVIPATDEETAPTGDSVTAGGLTEDEWLDGETVPHSTPEPEEGPDTEPDAEPKEPEEPNTEPDGERSPDIPID